MQQEKEFTDFNIGVAGLDSSEARHAHKKSGWDDSCMQCCGFEMFIPDKDFSIPDLNFSIPDPHPQKWTEKEVSIFNPKNCTQALRNMIRDVYPGFRIPNSDVFLFWITVPGIKKHTRSWIRFRNTACRASWSDLQLYFSWYHACTVPIIMHNEAFGRHYKLSFQIFCKTLFPVQWMKIPPLPPRGHFKPY